MDIVYTILIIVAIIIFLVLPTVRILYVDLYPYLKNAFSQDAALEKGVVANAEIIKGK